MRIVPILTIAHAQKTLIDRSINNDLVFNYQQCIEPVNRFFVNRQNSGLRNVDLRGENKPQKFVCQFCDAQKSSFKKHQTHTFSRSNVLNKQVDT